ncbi:MAG TPA: MASE1 domain-containing protein [Pseudolabrys sp.]|nr:MASE1 domain-containing protein [Pseudolabrys sp.]
MLQYVPKQVERKLPATSHSPQQWAQLIGLSVLVGIAYFLAARLSLLLLTKPDGVAVFWPASGVAAGVLIATGPRARLPVAAGAAVATIVANLLGDRTLMGAIVFALCNAGEALLAGWLIEKYFGLGFSLDRLSHVLGILAAATVAAAVSGVGGTAGFLYFHNSAAPVLSIWQHWFASDALGILTIAPLIIELASAARKPPPRRELIEGILALVILTGISGTVIFLPRGHWGIVVPIAALFPLLLWLAARCRPVFASGAAFIIAFTLVWMTTFGIGYFGDSTLSIEQHVLAAQATILATSLCALVLASLFAERRQHEAALFEGQARLQEALKVGGVLAFEWNARTNSSQRSDNAAQILGFNPKQTFSASEFLARIHPDDRAHFKALVHSVSPGKPSYKMTFRFGRPDGREIWLEESSRAEFDEADRCVQLKGLTVDITERKQSEERQGLLIAELDHRVKNLLAKVAVISTYTRQGSSSVDQFVEVLDKRIQSMANAHSLLSQSRWSGVNLADLVHNQLAPYVTIANTTIHGLDVTLAPATTQAVAMALHELVTNAVKYGALSNPNGHVSVSWDRQDGEDGTARVRIEWQETGGPSVVSPANPGYGTSLIRELIPHELGGMVDLTFAPNGVRCKIDVPIEQR